MNPNMPSAVIQSNVHGGPDVHVAFPTAYLSVTVQMCLTCFLAVRMPMIFSTTGPSASVTSWENQEQGRGQRSVQFETSGLKHCRYFLVILRQFRPKAAILSLLSEVWQTELKKAPDGSHQVLVTFLFGGDSRSWNHQVSVGS